MFDEGFSSAAKQSSRHTKRIGFVSKLRGKYNFVLLNVFILAKLATIMDKISKCACESVS